MTGVEGVDGYVTYANDHYHKIMGMEEGESMGNRWVNLIHPEDRDFTLDTWQKFIDTEDEIYQVDCRIVGPDGSITWVMSHATREYNEKGELLGHVGTLTDISKQKSAEQALAIKEERFSLAMEGANDGLWDWDVKTGEFYLSLRWYEMSGYERAKIPEADKAWKELLHPDDLLQVLEFQTSCFNGEVKSTDIECRLRHKDGHYVDILSRVNVICGDDNFPVRMTGTNTDITSRKQAEAQILAAKQQAETANRAKSDFLSSMSHELRTLINTILDYTQLLEHAAAEPLTENQKTFVDEILRSGHHMLALIGDVLDLAKIENGDVSFELKDEEPQTLIATCLKMIEPLALQNDIAVTNRVKEEDLPLIRVDTLRFRQSVLNLLSNAVKYNKTGGEVVVQYEYGANASLRVKVTDTGNGIPVDMREGVFDPFDRLGAENSTTPGTGIGLSVSKQLIEYMSGDIDFDSTIGEGSTFWIEVPVATAAPVEVSPVF
jgi:PAS domain S-box-containing protein